MELNEEKQLKQVVADFGKVVQVFVKKDYEKAEAGFDALIEQYKDSEFFSVMEVLARAGVYKSICGAQLNPVKTALKDDQDFLNEGLFQLNAGNYPEARKHLEKIEGKGHNDAYAAYLLSLVYYKQEEVDRALESLGKAVKLDPFYKIIAHNEPDFDPLFDNDQFNALMEQ